PAINWRRLYPWHGAGFRRGTWLYRLVPSRPTYCRPFRERRSRSRTYNRGILRRSCRNRRPNTIEHVLRRFARAFTLFLLAFPASFLHLLEERRVGKECRSRWSPY